MLQVNQIQDRKIASLKIILNLMVFWKFSTVDFSVELVLHS